MYGKYGLVKDHDDIYSITCVLNQLKDVLLKPQTPRTSATTYQTCGPQGVVYTKILHYI